MSKLSPARGLEELAKAKHFSFGLVAAVDDLFSGVTGVSFA